MLEIMILKNHIMVKLGYRKSSSGILQIKTSEDHVGDSLNKHIVHWFAEKGLLLDNGWIKSMSFINYSLYKAHKIEKIQYVFQYDSFLILELLSELTGDHIQF